MGGSMFSWRNRIGYIAPTVIEVVAYEFYRFAPDGIGLTGVTCSIDDWRPEEFEKGLAQVAAAATYLGSRGVNFIIHGGGPLVVARGPGYEDMIVREVAAAGKGKAAQAVEELEQGSGKLVVAYTHACFFVAFKAMGVNDAIHGHGRLLASLANPS